MTAKFKTVMIHEDLKEKLEFIARMLKKKQSQTLGSLIVPVWKQLKQIELCGFKSANIKTIVHPMKYIVIIELYPSDVVQAKQKLFEIKGKVKNHE